MPTRVGTLTRRSTDEQHQPFSIELQDTKLGAYIKSQDDWTLVRKYTDNKSGATLDREGLQRALADARAGLYDVLLVYKVDRLARTVRGLAQILDELDDAGVAFRSATEPFDTATAAGRMLVQMLGVIAEFERATIIDRVIGGMERKAARGEWCGGFRPYGYEAKTTADKTHVLVPHPIEAPLVRVIFDLYANSRLGTHAIGAWLTDNGHRTKAGKPWNHRAVLTILRNRVYLGEVFFRDTWHPGRHLPLVDQITFNAATALLAERGEAHSKRASNASDYLLVSRVRCQRCGKAFVGAAAHGKRHRYPYYVCFSRQRYGTQTCPAERLRADLLDQAVIDALLATFQQSDLFEQAIAASRARPRSSTTSTRPSLPPSRPRSPRPRPPSNATWTPSRLAPCRMRRVVSGCKSRAPRSPSCGCAKPSYRPPWTRPTSRRPAATSWPIWPSRSGSPWRRGQLRPASGCCTPSSTRSRSTAAT
jgi:site-specific DNA recombinase